MKCTEEFYRKNVEEEMALSAKTGDLKNSLEQEKMKDILNRIAASDAEGILSSYLNPGADNGTGKKRHCFSNNKSI